MASPPEDAEKPKTGWKEKLYDFVKNFTENTSFHGVRYTFEAATWFGRIAWILVVAVFFVWFTFQTLSKIAYFFTYPVVVDLKFAYNSTLLFPTVAICNTNQFRMTKAVDAGIFQHLEKFYAHDAKARRNLTFLDDRDRAKTMMALAHKKEDVIRMCKWQGLPCSHNNFTTAMTEFGVCFFFNDLIQNPEQTLAVQNTGSSYGLELYLNAEVYELSPGPHLPSGIQVLTFDGNDRPRVSDLGVAVPVFAVSRVALQVTTMSRLGDPYGKCMSKTLRDYKEYTFQACLAETYTNKTAAVCKCIGIGQKWTGPNKPPYCNFSTVYGCFQDINSRPIRHSCTHPCKSRDYSNTLSNTDLSTTSIGTILTSCRNDLDLLEKYRKALLYRERVVPAQVRADIQILKKLNWKKNFLDKTQKVIRKGVANLKKTVKKVRPLMKKFSRQVEAMTKTTTRNFGIVFEYRALERYLAPGLISLQIRSLNLYQTTLPDSLKVNMFKTDADAKALIKHLVASLPLFYSNSIEVIASVSFLFNKSVKKLLGESKKKYNGKLIPRKVIDGKKKAILKAIDGFTPTAKTVLKKMKEFQALASSLVVNMQSSAFNKLYAKLLKSAVAVSKAQETLQPKADALLESMKSVITDIEENAEAFETSFTDTKTLVKTLNYETRKYGRFMKRFKVVEGEKYFTKLTTKSYALIKIWPKITKEKLIEILSPPRNVTAAIRQYRKGSDKLTDALHSIQETKEDLVFITQLSTATNAIAKEEPKLKKNAKKLLTALKNLKKAVESMLKPTKIIPQRIDDYLETVKELLTNTIQFNRTLRIDRNMVQGNILAIQVFYRSLSFTDVSKAVGYDWFSLLSDIGGTAGLFLGGSFITVLELIYYIGKTVEVPDNVKEKIAKIKMPKPKRKKKEPKAQKPVERKQSDRFKGYDWNNDDNIFTLTPRI